VNSILIICLLICLLGVWYVFMPYFEGASGSNLESNSKSFSALQDQRERCLQVLRDLELDKATGKVSSEEYARMRASVGKELLVIVDQLKVAVRG
jgi:hypothetical protein